MNYNNDEKALIWLNNIVGLNISKKQDLIDYFGSPYELLLAIKTSCDEIKNIVGEVYYNHLLFSSDDTSIDKFIFDLNSKNIIALANNNDKYPHSLSDIFDPPLVLYCRGNLDLLNSRTFAVVGTRKITKYGREVTKKFTKELSYSGFTIVSGLARGVDSVAHEETLECSGNTIAVLGSGIDIIYPSENKDLALKILDKGLIVSEYPLGTKPLPQNFPQRNRIISGLACGVLITEAGMKSGSMITANVALEQGKDIFVIPGSIFSEESAGTNDMIKKRENVIMTTNINDIFEVYNIKSKYCNADTLQLDFVEQSIIDELKNGDMHIEEIISKTKLEAGRVITILTNLEIVGLIKKLSGNTYSIINK